MSASDNIEIPVDELDKFSRKWGIQEMSFFGSVLTAGFSPESDIDIHVTFKESVTYGLFGFMQMQEELSTIFGRNVDLVTRQSIESSRNYIRKRAILDSLETAYVA